MNKKVFIYVLCFYLATCFYGCSGCKALRKLTDSERKANIIISSATPASLKIEWTSHTVSNWYSYTTTESSFTFKETAGETWAQITNYSISFVGSDGTDLSAYNFSGGLNLFIDKNSTASSTFSVYSQPLIEATAPGTLNPYLTIQATITFTGKDGVGNNITIYAPYTITQNLLTIVAD